MKRVTALVVCAGFALAGCGKKEPVPEGRPVSALGTRAKPAGEAEGKDAPAASFDRITAQQAVAKALQAAKEDGPGPWKVAFLSNTGVTQSVSGEESRGADGGLVHADGTAAQWVVELYTDSPKPVSQGGRNGFLYPFVVCRATSRTASLLPGSEMAFPSKLSPVPPPDRLNAARILAMQQVKGQFDVCSAASDVKPGRPASWRFRFYDLRSKDIVAKVHVSGDGKKVLAW